MFLDSSVLGYVPVFNERRSAHRRSVCEDAILIIPSEDMTLPCRVVNMSEGGAGIRCDVIPRVATPVTLALRDGRSFQAVTAWYGNGQLGLSFTTVTDSE